MLRELLPVLVAGLVPIAVLTLIVTGTALSLVAWQPPIMQTTRFGTANSGNGITAMSIDATGVYVTGFVGYVNVTPSHLFVSKYSLDGRQVWTQRFGNATDFSQLFGIGVGADGVYIAGEQPGGLYLGRLVNESLVRKYDLSGNQLWSDRFGSDGSAATTISVNTAGVYVGGYSGPSTRVFVKDYDFNGTLVWSQLLENGTSYISVYAGPRSIYAIDAGIFRKYDPKGDLIWTRTCFCDTLTGDSAGLYAVGRVLTSGGTSDGFLRKYDLDGNQLWSTQFSAPGFNSVSQVGVSSDSSGVYLATTTSDGRGIVMKYDGNGSHIWSLQFPQGTGGNAIAVGDASVYVGGASSTMSSTGNLAFIALLSKSSSLVFFGINPPFSFGLVGLLAAAVVASILWLRRRSKRRLRSPSARPRYRSQKVPADMFR